MSGQVFDIPVRSKEGEAPWEWVGDQWRDVAESIEPEEFPMVFGRQAAITERGTPYASCSLYVTVKVTDVLEAHRALLVIAHEQLCRASTRGTLVVRTMPMAETEKADPDDLHKVSVRMRYAIENKENNDG